MKQELHPTSPNVRSLRAARMSAGNLLVAMFFAFGVAILLNAQGLNWTAHSMNPSPLRSIAINVTGPLSWIASHTPLGWPRSGFLAASGRSSKDDVASLAPTTTTSSPVSTTTTTMAPTPQAPLTVWPAGDSLVTFPGGQLATVAASNPAVAVAPTDAHVSTGLARPEIFNWHAHIDEVAKVNNPRLFVFMFGANDDQPLTGPGGGQPFGTQEWKDQYKLRVLALLDYATQNGAKVIWIGIPQIENSERGAEYELINSIYKEAASERKGKAYYFDTWKLLSTPEGAYTPRPVIDGQEIDARAPDGIHLTQAGARVVAERVLKKIGKIWNIEDWRKQGTPAGG